MMYRMRKIISHDDEIELPKCMYTIKNIYSFEDSFKSKDGDCNLNINKQVTQFLQAPNKNMTELENRQDQLLKKLDVLHDRIKQLSSICTVNSKPELGFKSNQSTLPIPEEIVLAAGPENLPWFLYLILKQTCMSVNINWHIHSSVPNEKVAKIKGFLKNFKTIKDSNINLRLIFKGGIQDSELRLSPLTVPIVGNVNILRYLAFVYPSVISYNDDYNVDSLLDICHTLERVSEKNKEALVNKLFGQYKEWIYSNTFSIVDLAAFNVVKQWRNPTKFVPKEWFEKCEKTCLM